MSAILEEQEGQVIDKDCTLRVRPKACKADKGERTPEERQAARRPGMNTGGREASTAVLCELEPYSPTL